MQDGSLTYTNTSEWKGLVLSGFRKAHISDAISEASNLVQLCENSFPAIEMTVDYNTLPYTLKNSLFIRFIIFL